MHLKSSFIQQKWIVSTLGMFSCSLMYMQHAGMSGAIVRMTAPLDNSTNNSSSNHHQTAPHFDWDGTLQGLILGGVFYLYWIVPTLVGTITHVFGGKWLTFVGVLGPGILTALTPLAATHGPVPLIIVQALIGATQGFLYPSLYHLYVEWFPPDERSKANAGIQVGQSIGGALMYLIVGYLCETPMGWPMVFYVECAFYIPWIICWVLFVEDKPQSVDWEIMQENKTGSKSKTPILAIATSGVVWASTLSKVACGYGFFMLLSKLPAYLDSAYGIPIVENGFINSAGFASYGVMCFIAPYISNYIIQKQYLSRIATRRLFQGICMLGPAACLFIVTLIDGKGMVIALIIIAMFSYGFVTGGEWTIVSEYAPNNVGFVSGFAHILALLTGVLAPYISGLILDSNIATLRLKWNISFYISSALYVVCYLAFYFMSSDKQQHWDKI